jgi:exonuclease SbcC
MSMRLKSLSVENFRSIRGLIQVPLDAPVVLIHGPNGAGKTSLLSAIETGLMGSAPTLERIDPGYIAYLPHKDAPDDRAQIAITMIDGADERRAELTITPQAIAGAGLLTPDRQRFFTERCYLGQSTLGRLLEIYQHQDARKTDSALTRFVKEILGLDPLDALIEGLHSAGHVTRLRSPAPTYWSAREELPSLEKQLAGVDQELISATLDQSQATANLAAMLAETGDRIENNLVPSIERDESELLALARIRRDLASVSGQVGAAFDAAGGEPDLVQNDATARQDLEIWRMGPGLELRTALELLIPIFPSLPPMGNNIEAARAAAEQAMKTELSRIDTALSHDAQVAGRQAELDEAIGQGRARLGTLDSEMSATATATEALATALSLVAPHIHDEDCPICGRDFQEISDTPLATHLSSRIRDLVATAGRLQGLARDKATTAAAVSRSEAERQQLVARRIPGEQIDALKLRRASLAEHTLRIQGLTRASSDGAALQARQVLAARALAEGQSRQTALGGLHSLVKTYAAQLGVIRSDKTDLQGYIQALLERVANQESSITVRQDKRRRILASLRETAPLAARIVELQSTRDNVQERLMRTRSHKAEADHRIELAKGLSAEARTARTALVRRVFNDELNAVWRELFIRLAPDEPFIPAFALPKDGSGAVEAALETHYRSGGFGGNPRTMLSAGNLNTAALTLFLALHLSVRPTLPWLVIDDPVQSMDEVHIAQFAALLRTLSKQQGRQVIVAVHERSLFDYLALELSPAFLDDRLITIELGRSANGVTTAAWDLRTFQPDRAIAA